MGKSTFDFANYNRFQKNLANAEPNDWQCRAGSRYLYVCEDGLVHWCSQQRGHPGIPLERYGPDDLQRRISRGEALRAALHRRLRASRGAGRRAAAQSAGGAVSVVRRRRAGSRVRNCRRRSGVLQWAFITSPRRDLFRARPRASSVAAIAGREARVRVRAACASGGERQPRAQQHQRRGLGHDLVFDRERRIELREARVRRPHAEDTAPHRHVSDHESGEVLVCRQQTLE